LPASVAGDIVGQADLTPDRAAFRAYAALVLAEVTGDSAALRRRHRDAHVRGFTLRSLHQDDRGDAGIEPVAAAPADPLALTALLALTTPHSGYLPIWAGTSRHRPTGAVVSWNHQGDRSPDFAFKYPIGEMPQVTAASRATLLAIIADCIDLRDGDGAIVDVDEIDGEPVPHYEPWRALDLGIRSDGRDGTGELHPLHSVAATEPTILCLARHWRLVTQEWDFAAPGGAAMRPVDAFRLRHLPDWVVPADGHPAEVYEYLARVCNVACDFCYLYGNPSTLAVARGQKVIKDTELETRLKYYDPATSRSLFHAQWEINEFLVDPKIHSVLPALRKRSPEPFYFITNGSPLKGKVLDLLSAIKPVHLIVSINSLDEALRGSVMHERAGQTTTAVGALHELARRQIPFGISIAAFPEFPLADIQRTIRIVDGIGAGFVRVNQPGFTRELPYAGSFDTEKRWADVIAAIREIRGQVGLPVFTIPSAHEENHFNADALAARVIGAVPGSPAHRVGLSCGDVIETINGMRVRTRSDVIPLLLLARNSVRMVITRGGQPAELSLGGHDDHVFPYDGDILCKYLFPWGVVVAPCLSASSAAQVERHIAEVGARSALLLTSPVMRPAAEQLLARFAPLAADVVRYAEPANDFLGGNIRVLDMATIGDFAREIDRDIAGNGPPDLILVAESAFNRHGRDLRGRHWRDLERTFDLPVRLLSVSRFAF